MENPYKRLIGLTINADGSPEYLYKEAVGAGLPRPPGVDLRVPVRYGENGLFFYSNQGLVLDPATLAIEWTHLFAADGMSCLLARPHAKGELKLLTTQLRVPRDLGKMLELDIGDACVDPEVGLYVAGNQGAQAVVTLLDPVSNRLGSWNLGSTGDSLEWGAAGQQWAGYLVGDKFFVKEPDSNEFEDYAIPPSSKVFWTNVRGGAFVLRRNDGWIQLVSPKSSVSSKLFQLADNEDLLRIDDDYAVLATDQVGTSYRHQSLFEV